MKSGFTIVEILIAMAISSMLSVALFVALGQFNASSTFVEDQVDVATKAAIVHQQLEKDVMGAFIPLAAEDQKSTSTQTVLPSTAAAAEAEKPRKKITKVFYGSQRDNNFDTLTLITDNPLQVYWSDKAGKAKPRIARVVYRLVPDKKEKKLFTLMRQEGQELDFDVYKSGSKELRAYEVIDNIKSLALEYVVTLTPEQGKEKQKKELKKSKEWKGADTKDEQKKDAQQKTFPDYITVNLTLWDALKKRDTLFTFIITLIADGKQPEEKPITMVEKVLQGVKEAKTAQPGAATPGSGAASSAVPVTTSAASSGVSVPTSIELIQEPIELTKGMSLESYDGLTVVVSGSEKRVIHAS